MPVIEGTDLLSMKEDQIRITGSLNGRGEVRKNEIAKMMRKL